MELPACLGRIDTRCCNECRNCDVFCRCIHATIEKVVVQEVMTVLAQVADEEAKCQECIGGCGCESEDAHSHTSSETVTNVTDCNG